MEKGKKIKISVIIPVYNEEELIKNCINSLTNQDYPLKNYEIVIINDGSTDKTKENVEKTIRGNKKIKIRLINQSNKGRAMARLEGAKKAKYNNLLFIDSRCSAEKYLLSNISRKNYPVIVGNPIIKEDSIYGRFGYLFRKKLYKTSLNKFDPFFIDEKNFNSVSKSTTVLLIDKTLFLSSQPDDKKVKDNSDDTKLLWNVVKKIKIFKDPSAIVFYQPRVNLLSHLKHTFNRGPKFIDYYLNFNSGNRYMKFIILFLSMLLLSISLILYKSALIIPLISFIFLVFVIICILLSEKFSDFFILIPLLFMTSISFAVGLLKGIFMKLLGRY